VRVVSKVIISVDLS